ncbi:MAG: LytTR family transcriptional regulator [Crocinitomicaceae bacterium]|nr:LytTR family transcriptional regulator [Flavobacteriales bacterium]NQZ38227.1 LytTR family transcriptional regulator [Crocinitomicaceae bacterium]
MLDFFKVSLEMNLKSKLGLCLGSGLLVFVFLIIFQPFYTNVHLRIPFVLAAGCYSMGTLLLTSYYVFGWRGVLIKMRKGEWTLGNEILAIIVNVSLIGIGNNALVYIIHYRDRIAKMTFWEGALDNILMVYAIAVIPIFISIMVSWILYNSNILLEVDRSVSSKEGNSERFLTLTCSDVDKSEPPIVLSSNLFRFARASGNYIECFSLIDGKPERQLCRNTLSNFEKEISDVGFNIIRCHRSYLVNLNNVRSFSGNRHGYVLKIDDFNVKVPVSRKKVEEFNSRISHDGNRLFVK